MCNCWRVKEQPGPQSIQSKKAWLLIAQYSIEEMLSGDGTIYADMICGFGAVDIFELSRGAVNLLVVGTNVTPIR